MADPQGRRPWTPPPPPAPGSLAAILEMLTGNVTPPPAPEAPSIPVPGTALKMPTPPDLLALANRTAQPPQAEAPWFVKQPMSGAQFGQNLAQDLPDTTHMLWQMVTHADEILPMLGKGLAGAMVPKPEPFGLAESGQMMKEGLASTWGDPLRYFYDTPAQFAADVIDPTDLGIQGGGLLGMALPMMKRMKLPFRGKMLDVPNEFGIPGFYSRTREAIRSLDTMPQAKRSKFGLNAQGELAISRVLDSLKKAGASPEEMSLIKLDEGLKALEAERKAAGAEATVSLEDLYGLVEARSPEFETERLVKYAKPSQELTELFASQGWQMPEAGNSRAWRDIRSTIGDRLYELFPELNSTGVISERSVEDQALYRRLEAARDEAYQMQTRGHGETSDSYRQYSYPVKNYQVELVKPTTPGVQPTDRYRAQLPHPDVEHNPLKFDILNEGGMVLTPDQRIGAPTPEAAVERYLADNPSASVASLATGHWDSPNLGHLRFHEGVTAFQPGDAPRPANVRPTVNADTPGYQEWLQETGRLDGYDDPADIQAVLDNPYTQDDFAEHLMERARESNAGWHRQGTLSGRAIMEVQTDAHNVGRAEGFSDHPLTPVGSYVRATSGTGAVESFGPFEPDMVPQVESILQQYGFTTDTQPYVQPTVTMPDGRALPLAPMPGHDVADLAATRRRQITESAANRWGGGANLERVLREDAIIKALDGGAPVTTAPGLEGEPTAVRMRVEGEFKYLTRLMELIDGNRSLSPVDRAVALAQVEQKMYDLTKGEMALGGSSGYGGRRGPLSQQRFGGLPQVGPNVRPEISQASTERIMLRRAVYDAMADENADFVSLATGAQNADVYGKTRYADQLRMHPRGKVEAPERGGYSWSSFTNEGDARDAAQRIQQATGEALEVLPDGNGHWGLRRVTPTIQGMGANGAGVVGRLEPHSLADVDTAVGRTAADALRDPLNAVPVGRPQEGPIVTTWTPDNLAEERAYYARYYPNEDVEATLQRQAESRLASEVRQYQVEVGSDYTVEAIPTGEPYSYQLRAQPANPDYRRALADGLAAGLSQEQAAAQAASLFDLSGYESLRQTLEAMGHSPDEARRMAESFSPTEYADAAQEFAPQWMRAQGNVERRVQRGLPGVEDAQAAVAALDDEWQRKQRDLAWREKEVQKAAPVLQRMEGMPRQLQSGQVDPGFGEEFGYPMSKGDHENAFKLRESYNARYPAILKEIEQAIGQAAGRDVDLLGPGRLRMDPNAGGSHAMVHNQATAPAQMLRLDAEKLTEAERIQALLKGFPFLSLLLPALLSPGGLMPQDYGGDR